MSDLATFLAEENAIHARIVPRASRASWELAITGSEAAAAESEAAHAAILAHYCRPEVFAQIKRYLEDPSLDRLTRRQLVALKEEYLANQFPPEAVAGIARLSTELESLFSSYRGTIDGQPVTDNYATGILQSSTDSGLRRKAWEATKMVAGEAAPRLKELVRTRNSAAEALGYPDYYHLMLDAAEVDIERMAALWDRLAEATDPAWAVMKGELDERLAARYDIAVTDLMPWHYEDPNFQKAPQNPDANLDEWYSASDVEALTTETFRRMGQPIEDLVAKSSLYPQEGKYQSAFCSDIDREGDIRVCCSIVPNERWMATNLHEFGHASYDKYVEADLPWLIRCASHSITTEGVAIFHGNFANDPEWMTEYAGFDADEVARTLPVIRKQKQLEDLIFTRWEQVMCRFERALYAHPEQDLDALWWDIVERYQGLTRPAGRQWPDWASKVHFSVAPCMYHNYLYGFMFITQLAETLREKVTDGGPLASPAVGEYLIEQVYRPGGSLRWDEVIEQATGQPLNPGAWIAHVTAGVGTPATA